MDKMFSVKNTLEDIYETGNIRKYKLTPSDVFEVSYSFKEIKHRGFVETISENVKNFYQRFGYTIEEYGMGWKILS